MPLPPKSYKRGRWVFLGTALGAFVGLLVGKFALGMIFGFFVGLVIDSLKQRALSSGHEHPPDEGTNV